MKNYLRLNLSADQGSVSYSSQGINPNAPPLTGANDGTSQVLGIVKLGQSVGAAGDPAILTENREIPDPGGFTVSFGRNNGVDNVVVIGPNLGVALSNNTGNGLSLAWQIGANSTDINIHTTDAASVIIDFAAGTDNIIYNGGTPPIKRFVSSAAWVSTGRGSRIHAVTGVASYDLTVDDSTILVDTTAGNIVINMDPTKFPNQDFDIKKTSADVNTITLTPLAPATIQAFGAPAATYAFNVQGESIRVQTDGINFYVL